MPCRCMCSAGLEDAHGKEPGADHPGLSACNLHRRRRRRKWHLIILGRHRSQGQAHTPHDQQYLQVLATADTSPEHQHLCWTPAKCLSTAVQMFESATKGAILMYSKEAILKVLHTTDISPGKQQRSFRFPRSVTLVFGALGSMEMMSKASIPR